MSKTNGRTNCRSDRSVWQEYRGEPSGCVSRLMLWRYPNRTALEPGVRLLPEVLKKAGYQTCHIGKWHVTENPLQNGMDINIAGNHIGHPKSYFSPYGMEIWKNGPEDDRLLFSSRLLLAQEFPNIVLFLVDDMGVMDTFLPFFDG